MKKLLFVLPVLALFAFTAKQVVYNADVKNSTVKWQAKKTTGEHAGDIFLKSGSLNFDGTTPVNGEFVLDMNSITVTDVADAESNKKLAGHLKGDDFFSAATYPTATINVKKFEKAETAPASFVATADLTIKGVTNEIKFPCKVTVNGKSATAAADITIDRTRWGITYKSKSVLGAMADKFIYDDIAFTVKLALTK
jgi:polyisoprenoid-binding protein YceI